MPFEPSLYGIIGVLFLAIASLAGTVTYLFKRVTAADAGHTKCREDLAFMRGELGRIKAELDRMAFQSILDAVIVADDQGVIRQWNPTATSLFGWDMMEALGKHITMLMSPELLPEHQKGWTSWINDKRPPKHGPYDAVARCKDGKDIGVVVSLSAWQESGKTFCTAHIRRRLSE